MSKLSPEFTSQELRVIAAVDKGDILGANLASLSQTSRLTHAQNVELGEDIQRSLATSRRKSKIKPKIHELALGNSGLAAELTLSLASQTPLTEEDLEDCLQNSLIKLLEAAKIYDPWFEAEPTANSGDAARFSTIAFPYIQGGLKSSEPEFQSITLPRSMADRVRRYHRNSGLREQLGLSLDHQEISDTVAKKRRSSVRAGRPIHYCQKPATGA
jgi:DNA-directed RNA polymerase specialized sigma subunit